LERREGEMKRQKKVGFYTRTRDPVNTFSNFWDAPVSQIKTGRNTEVITQIEKPLIKQEMQDGAREKHDAGIIPSSEPRFKPSMFVIKITDKAGNVRWMWKKNGKVKRYAAPIGNHRQPKEVKKVYNKETFKRETVREPETFNEERDSKHVRDNTNFNYVKKKHFGRFSRNPKQPGRDAIPSEMGEENPISNVRYNETLITHVRNNLLKGGK
jgi:hypothetical protein